jgi:hypothetical protein
MTSVAELNAFRRPCTTDRLANLRMYQVSSEVISAHRCRKTGFDITFTFKYIYILSRATYNDIF